MTEQRNGEDISGLRLNAAHRVAPGIIGLLFGCALGALLPGAAQAQAAFHELTWAHASPESVSRFVVFASTVDGNQAGARLINVGKPANPTPTGSVFVYSAVVLVDLSEYVAVAAVGLDGSMSSLSTWSGVPPTAPGQPQLKP